MIAHYLNIEKPTLGDYLSLDDSVIWADLVTLSKFNDRPECVLAKRLIDRKLFKCFDLSGAVGMREPGNRIHRFMRELNTDRQEGKYSGLLIDDAQISGYKYRGYESTSALEKVLVKRNGGDAEPIDIADFSEIVKSLIARNWIYRLYVPTHEEAHELDQRFRGIHQ